MVCTKVEGNCMCFSDFELRRSKVWLGRGRRWANMWKETASDPSNSPVGAESSPEPHVGGEDSEEA